ncbi:MAG: 4-(cytidine 5'-diphospho)-2-C-methyl-D-erythritol kinase [Clostridia bacterium]|nr:4-(cytidine 5'-diphospho)-2-C-methyl-D-erythritol kinase [Clostridia bacterium]
MKKVKIKVPAKINLTLDITGVKDGYHVIESLVASIDVFDVIRVKKRKENYISVSFSGIPTGVSGRNSNAYLAAETFVKEFGTGGAEINIERRIPAAAGLGGSSADIAGVLAAMGKLYRINRDLSYIADKLGSDVSYMLKGGYAVIKDRGEIVERVPDIKNKFYLLIVAGSKGVSTSESYKGYDRIGKTYRKHTGTAINFLREDDPDNFFKLLKNDLYESSAGLLPEIKETLTNLKKFGAAVMTGSGSAVYGIYKTKKERDKVYKALFNEYGDRLIKTETL